MNFNLKIFLLLPLVLISCQSYFEPIINEAAEKAVKEFTKRIDSFGLDIGSIRSGGTLTEAKNGPQNIEKLKKSINYGKYTGAEVVNGAISAPSRYPGNPEGSLPASGSGWNKSQDSSKEASMWVYEHLSKIYQESCDEASDLSLIHI